MTADPRAMDLVRTVERFWSLGAQVRDADGGTVVRRPATPDHPLGNFLCRVRTDDPVCLELLVAPDTEAGLPALDRVLIDDDTPAGIAAQLAVDDWRLESQLVLVLDEPDNVTPPSRMDVTRVRGDDGWAAVGALFRIDHLEEDARAGRAPRAESATRAAVDLRRHLGVEVEYHLVGGESDPVGCIAVWVDATGVGMIEDVFVHPRARGAGVATDLLRLAVGRTKDRGADRVVICAEVDDTPKHLYHRFGFRPATVVLSYER